GIRYLIVTGVQTCALPIYGGGLAGSARLTACGHGLARCGNATLSRNHSAHSLTSAPSGQALSCGAFTDDRETDDHEATGQPAARSEERRVGKECKCDRSRT